MHDMQATINKNMICMFYLKRNRKLTSPLGCLPRSSKLKSKIDSPGLRKLSGVIPLLLSIKSGILVKLCLIIKPISLASNIICIGSNLCIRHLLLFPQLGYPWVTLVLFLLQHRLHLLHHKRWLLPSWRLLLLGSTGIGFFSIGGDSLFFDVPSLRKKISKLSSLHTIIIY